MTLVASPPPVDITIITVVSINIGTIIIEMLNCNYRYRMCFFFNFSVADICLPSLETVTSCS